MIPYMRDSPKEQNTFKGLMKRLGYTWTICRGTTYPVFYKWSQELADDLLRKKPRRGEKEALLLSSAEPHSTADTPPMAMPGAQELVPAASTGGGVADAVSDEAPPNPVAAALAGAARVDANAELSVLVSPGGHGDQPRPERAVSADPEEGMGAAPMTARFSHQLDNMFEILGDEFLAKEEDVGWEAEPAGMTLEWERIMASA